MDRQLTPAGLKALSIILPSETRTITLPTGQTALRHILPEGMTGWDLDQAAAEGALKAAGLIADDVDLILCASFPALPEPCIGNATPLASRMGMSRAAAWNVESACAGGLIAFRTACNEVMLGEFETVLVVVGCPYSVTINEGHPATDVVGDAAFAMVVGPTAPGQELLGSVIRNSGPTCTLVDMVVDTNLASGIRLAVGKKTAGQLEEWALKQLPELSSELFERTGLKASDVDHWVCNAPTPKFADRAFTMMGAGLEDGVNTNRVAGNVGPALIGVSLFYNALLRDFQPGDLVLCCSVGSEASLALSLMRWPENVAFGEVPAQGSLAALKTFEVERLAQPVT